MAEDRPGLHIETADQIINNEIRLAEEAEADVLGQQMEDDLLFKSSLAGHILEEFGVNKDAKEASGIKEEIFESLRAFNGEYSPKDLALIEAEGGSKIFMNITATKARAAKSWIADVLKPAKGKAWTVMPTPNPDLPDQMIKSIEEAIKKEFEAAADQVQSQEQPAEAAQETIKDINQKKRDIKIAMNEEIQKEAQFQMDVMERQIEDQFAEGKFSDSLTTFIDDFVVYPTAFMKGPIVEKSRKMRWENGQAVVEEAIIFGNGRVDALDMYPSPNATCVNDGNSCEHLRLSRKELSLLRNAPNYYAEGINKVLTNSGYTPSSGTSWWEDGAVETEKADQERRGNEFEANRGVYHGIHFFGPIAAKILKEWEFVCDGFDPMSDDNDMIEVEAIIVDHEVIKCVVNDDPLLRRPYYKASFMNRPGSYWGRSLPNLMRDIQRMCNATARALANNLGFASGPSMEVNIDLLASKSDGIQGIGPRMIIQTKSDPIGNKGKAINWFQPDSNARELLEVYTQFEQRADDVTGIPRYAYGNERVSGAAATLGGLSMLLESASKIIKDAIRNIDDGLIKPRVEQQFYMNMLKNPNKFTGDVTVVPIGSAVLSIKAFEAMRRNEFLTATANQFDQETMGRSGRANILRKVAEDIGLDGNPIPTDYELKQQEKKSAEAAAQAAEREAQEKQADREVSYAATDRQISGQESMAAGAQQLQAGELQRKLIKDQTDAQLKAAEIDQRDMAINKEIITKERTGSGI